MKIIEDLYYGRISPYEMSISTTPEYQKLKAFADRNEDLLRESYRNRDGYILYIRAGYVHQWLQDWHKADD